MSELLARVRTHPVLGRIFRFRPLAPLIAVLLVFATATATAEAPTGSVIYGRIKAQDVRLSMPPTEQPKGIVDLLPRPERRRRQPHGRAVAAGPGPLRAGSSPPPTSTPTRGATRRPPTTPVNLVAWAEEQTGNLPIKLYVSGSMGGTVSLNAMTHAGLVPPCWYGVKPAVDLTKMDNVPGRPADHPRGVRRRRPLRPQPGQHHRPAADRDPLPDGHLARGHLGPRVGERRPARRRSPGPGRGRQRLRGARHPRRPLALRRRRPARVRGQLRERAGRGGARRRHRERRRQPADPSDPALEPDPVHPLGVGQQLVGEDRPEPREVEQGEHHERPAHHHAGGTSRAGRPRRGRSASRWPGSARAPRTAGSRRRRTGRSAGRRTAATAARSTRRRRRPRRTASRGAPTHIATAYSSARMPPHQIVGRADQQHLLAGRCCPRPRRSPRVPGSMPVSAATPTGRLRSSQPDGLDA